MTCLRPVLMASVALTLALSAPPTSAQEKAAPAKAAKPTSLGELLKRVKAGYREDSAELKAREAEFKANKDKQAAMLRAGKAALAAEQKRSEKMEREFEQNEALMVQLEETLQVRLGNKGELFGVLRQAAGDARERLRMSLTSLQFPDRAAQLEPLTQSKALPSIEQIEKLWYLQQQEMIEQGKVVRFQGSLVNTDGQDEQDEIIRVGVFTAIGKGKFLQWKDTIGKLQELGRQPQRIYMETLDNLDAKEGYVRLAVDPSQGQLLGQLVQTPTFEERIAFGGVIGYIIIVIGIVTLALGILRLIMLAITGLLVARQKRRKDPGKRNPLGRILAIQAENKDLDVETLERKLDEAILKEASKLDRFLWAVKIVSVVAPLLGLLGTVTGMIQTFQSITLYGTGDPRMMAGGISEALVTTMLGLMVAIPLVLLHAWMKSMSRRVTEVLEEQSAGLVARCAEEAKASDPAAE